MAKVRHIPLEGTPNLRDLGGYPTDQGGTVAYGRLFRSGALADLTDADLQLLNDLRLRTVVDFRTSDEVRTGGNDRLPEGLEATACPVGGGSMQQFFALAVAGDPERLHEVLGEGRGAQMMVDVNRGFVSNEAEREQFSQALHLVAAGGDLPLLFHCTAGKDRTGWMAAIVLELLGVPRQTILADYILSNEYFRPVATEQLKALSFTGLDPVLFAPVIEQRPEYLQAAFDEADTLFGSFTGFVRDGLDLDEDSVARLRADLSS